jgi:hypothetical protein
VKRSYFAVPAALSSTAALLLAGCGGSSKQSGWALPEAGVSSRAAHGATYMKSDVTNADLLYISDANGEVTVYRYWQRTLVGILTNFTQPMGMCVNAGGDVFIADYGAHKVYEYAHGGTKAIASFDEAPLSPYTCAVNLATGDLAVANVDTSSSHSGDIAVYAHASGAPATYKSTELGNFEGCAYDSNGNLLATNGQAPGRNGPASFAWLPKGGGKLLDINLPGREPSWTWYFVDGIQWDGKYFVIDFGSELDRIALIKGLGYYVGDTSIEDASNGPYWIYNDNPKAQGTQFVAAAGSRSYGEVLYYTYPSGEGPIHYITHGLDGPFAVAVSLKKKH